MAGKTLKVEIIKKSGDKTVVGVYTTLKKHPKYGKYVKKSYKYMAHDENNETKIGDVVHIKESRPISKKKSWVVVKIEEDKKDVKKEKKGSE